MRKIASLFTVLMLLCTLAFGQTRTVTGTVRDENGNPVPFATVTEAGTRNGTTADEKGSFSLSIKQNARLAITATGFQTQTINPGSSAQTVTLSRTDSQLSEVVVTTALGVQRQKKELGYATARVSNAEMTQARPVNIANGLQGKVSGLNVTSINNNVFGEVKINLRGIRSLTGNNNPMLLLDGVPVALSYLSSLNPTDIQDVSILKGASAAAVYGPDARNGVIVVTTKKGNRSGAPVITFNHTTQLERISFWPKFQDQFGSGGYGDYIAYENWSWGPAYDGSVRDLGKPAEDGSQQTVVYSARPDEKKKFFNTGITLQNDISFAAQDFYVSLQDVKIKGIVPGDENRRTGIRLNTAKEYGRFKVNLNTNYIQQNYNIFDADQMEDLNSSLNVGLNSGLLNLIFNTPAHIPLTSYKDFKNSKWAQYNNYFNNYGINPYFAMDNWRQNGKNDNLLTNMELNFKAADWLNFTYRAAATLNTLTVRSISKGEIASEYAIHEREANTIPGATFERSYRSNRLSSEAFATINKTFKDFKVNAVVGHYFRQNDAKDTRVGTSNLVVSDLYNVGNRPGQLSGSGDISRTRMGSVYGVVGLGYKGWANLELTGRNDWVSVLAIGNNSFFYPGASASLVLSDAIPQIKNSNLVSYLKVRGSLNKTGNADISAYSLAATYVQDETEGFPYDVPGFTASNTIYDAKLKPEFIVSKELGVEVGILKNRINLEATYFNQDNTNQIVPVQVSGATGYTHTYVNAASFVNRGIEMDLKITPLVKFNKGSIELRANATYNDSKVNDIFGEQLKEISIGGYTFASNYAIKGYPAYVFKATDYVRDSVGRVIVDPATGMPSQDPNTKIFGRTMPLWIVGISPSVNWNGLTLSVVGEYKGGHYAYHQIGNEMAWTGVSAATARFNRERFVFPNSSVSENGKYVPNTNVVVNDVNDFYTGVYRDVASNFLTSASSWRIREVSLSYNVPVSILGNQKVVKALTVTLNARNLFLWLPQSNEYTDPDFTFSSTSTTPGGRGGTELGVASGNITGVSTSQINPPTRIYGANVSVRF